MFNIIIGHWKYFCKHSHSFQFLKTYWSRVTFYPLTDMFKLEMSSYLEFLTQVLGYRNNLKTWLWELLISDASYVIISFHISLNTHITFQNGKIESIAQKHNVYRKYRNNPIWKILHSKCAIPTEKVFIFPFARSTRGYSKK